MQQDRGHRGKELTHIGTETNFCSGACLGMNTSLASDIHPPPGALLSFRNPCAAEGSCRDYSYTGSSIELLNCGVGVVYRLG